MILAAELELVLSKLVSLIPKGVRSIIDLRPTPDLGFCRVACKEVSSRGNALLINVEKESMTMRVVSGRESMGFGRHNNAIK